MRIAKETLFGAPFLGLYSIATEKHIFLPLGFSKKSGPSRFSDILGVSARFINVYDSQLIGVFAAANSNGIIIPWISEKPRGIGNVTHVSDRMTALGNLVLANDFGAVISPAFSRTAETEIRGALGVEVVRGTIGGLDTVGSCGIATNAGALVSPAATEAEIDLIKSALKVGVDVGSLNRGSNYVGSCALANSKGALVGNLTTPIEITRMEDALGKGC